MGSPTTNRTISDKESWLIKHGSFRTKATSTGYQVTWVSKTGVGKTTTAGATYFSAINSMYDAVRHSLWMQVRLFS